MGDLIWVGNTLLPRWFVFAIPVAIVIAIYLFAFWVSRHQIGSRE